MIPQKFGCSVIVFLQGARNKSNTHFAAVYPPDTSNNSVALMYNEDIWWQENAAGNEMTNPNLAEGVARMFMDALEAKYPQSVFYRFALCLHCNHFNVDGRGVRIKIQKRQLQQHRHLAGHLTLITMICFK